MPPKKQPTQPPQSEDPVLGPQNQVAPTPPPTGNPEEEEDPAPTPAAATCSLEDVTAAMQAITKSIATTPSRRPRKAPEYSGSPYEDPSQFCHQLERLVSESHIAEEDLVPTAEDQLRGPAAEWYRSQRYQEMSLTWEGFRARLLLKYDSPQAIADILVALLTQKQDRTPAELFLHQKALAARRVLPTMGEESLAIVFKGLLRPELRLHLSTSTHRDLESLSQAAAGLEATLAALEEAKPRPPPTPRPRTTTAAPALTRQPPVPAAPQRTAQPTPAPQRAVPPCRYCPERHWHRDCPVLRASYRRPEVADVGPADADLSANHQGNEDRAG